MGAYVCPSLWNNNSYFPPNALTSFGPCCKPNYLPASDPTRWQQFTTFLHGLVRELSDLFAPDTFWFDCSNSPPNTDTHLEAVIETMRSANPDVVINIRGGMWSDYIESPDQSERLANTIFGTPREFVGEYFEIPAVMQSSRQWAYDPKSTQKPTAEFVSNLMMLTAKGGNYLMNVAPDPLGTWPASALLTLKELADWFTINGEAIHSTRPVWPYQNGETFIVGSSVTKAVYVLIPAMTPDHSQLMGGSPTPTGGALRPAAGKGAEEETAVVPPCLLHSRLTAGTQDNISLPWLRPSLFSSPLKSVELLGHSVPINYTISDADGVLVTGISLAQARQPAWSCNLLPACTCAAMGNFYGVGPAPFGRGGFGCAPAAAQHWWVDQMNCTAAGYATQKAHPGCPSPGTLPPRKKPQEIGLVLKLAF